MDKIYIQLSEDKNGNMIIKEKHLSDVWKSKSITRREEDYR